MDRRRFVIIAVESPLLALAACSGKESTPSEKFNSTFDSVFGDLEKEGRSVGSRIENLKFTAQMLRWSDGRQSGMDVLFKGVRPKETVGIADYIGKPTDVFVEDKNARTVVFGDGKSGRYALYSSNGKPVRAFAEGGAADVPAVEIDKQLAELKSHFRNRRHR